MWGEGKEIFSSLNGSTRLLRGVDNNFILAKLYRKNQADNFRYLEVQKFSLSGDLLWDKGIIAAQVPLLDAGGTDYSYFRACSDGFGGLFLTWRQGINTSAASRPFVQHVNVLGEKLWGDGIGVISQAYESFSETMLIITEDGLGGAVLVWEDSRNGGYDSRDIYGQHIYLNQKPRVLNMEITSQFTDSGQKVYFSGQGKDLDGQITSYEWRSNIDGFLSSQAKFQKENLTPGDHLIMLKVQDDRGAWSDEESRNLHVNSIPVATISSISPNPARVGEQVTLTGKGKDRDGTIVGYSWISDKDGYLGNVASLKMSTLSVGMHNIFFKVKDNNGVWSKEVSRQLLVNKAEAGMIFGTVYELKRNGWWFTSKVPLQGVTIKLIGITTGVIKTVVSDADGKFSIGSFPKGMYIIRADKKNYFSVLRVILLNKGEKSRIEIIMKKMRR